MQLSSAIITLQIFWAKPGNAREGGRVERSNEWGGRSREGEARAKPGNQLVLNKLKHVLPIYTLKTMYNALILPHFNYNILLWGFNSKRISKLQKRQLES